MTLEIHVYTETRQMVPVRSQVMVRVGDEESYLDWVRGDGKALASSCKASLWERFLKPVSVHYHTREGSFDED